MQIRLSVQALSVEPNTACLHTFPFCFQLISINLSHGERWLWRRLFVGIASEVCCVTLHYCIACSRIPEGFQSYRQHTGSEQSQPPDHFNLCYHKVETGDQISLLSGNCASQVDYVSIVEKSHKHLVHLEVVDLYWTVHERWMKAERYFLFGDSFAFALCWLVSSVYVSVCHKDVKVVLPAIIIIQWVYYNYNPYHYCRYY